MTEFEEYIQLYKERYGSSGPSFSSGCSKENIVVDSPFKCGCWKCHLLELREWKKSQS